MPIVHILSEFPVPAPYRGLTRWSRVKSDGEGKLTVKTAGSEREMKQRSVAQTLADLLGTWGVQFVFWYSGRHDFALPGLLRRTPHWVHPAEE